MKVLIVTQNFYPENFKGNDIAFELAKRGHKVDVLTGIPNYPAGKYFEGYGIFKKRNEKMNGVRIMRSFQIPRGKSKPGLVWNYLSFFFFASIRGFLLAMSNRYDCVFVQQTSPIIQAYPAIIVKKLQKIPLYMWILDIWPDSMVSGSGIKNESVIGIMNGCVKNIYNNCDRILISSKRFAELIISKGNYSDKLVYFPNWCEDLLNMTKEEIPKLPEGFIIMMAGNLGGAQKLDMVMNAALETKDLKEVKWVFVGDGSKKKWLEEFAKENHLEETVFTMGRYPFKTMPTFFSYANAMLLTLKSDWPHLKAVVPARLTSYMAAGRPVLAMVDGGSADLINESQCGYSVPADDYKALANMIREKVLPDKNRFEKMGENGYKFFEKNFTIDICMNHLEQIIKM